MIAVIIQIYQYEPEDLAKIETSNHLFEGLLTWSRGVSINDLVELGARQHFVLVVKGSPLAIDGHGRVW